MTLLLSHELDLHSETSLILGAGVCLPSLVVGAGSWVFRIPLCLGQNPVGSFCRIWLNETMNGHPQNDWEVILEANSVLAENRGPWRWGIAPPHYRGPSPSPANSTFCLLPASH